jgi:hypothetical protein
MKSIPLTKGLSAVVDDEDYHLVAQFKWFAQANGRTHYAARRTGSGGQLVLMHRLINNTPAGLLTDHRDGNGLNNVRGNLRDATPTQNARNTRPQLGASSALKGVWFEPGGKLRKRWRAGIRVNGRMIYLGRYLTETEAHAQYVAAAREHFGEFSRVSEGAQP